MQHKFEVNVFVGIQLQSGLSECDLVKNKDGKLVSKVSMKPTQSAAVLYGSASQP